MSLNYETVYSLVKPDAVLNCNSTSNTQLHTVPFNCFVQRAAIVIQDTENTSAVVKFSILPTAGDSSTGKVAGGAGACSAPASNSQGKYVFDDAKRGVQLKPGQQILVEVTTASSAAKNVVPLLLISYSPEIAANSPSMLATA